MRPLVLPTAPLVSGRRQGLGSLGVEARALSSPGPTASEGSCTHFDAVVERDPLGEALHVLPHALELGVEEVCPIPAPWIPVNQLYASGEEQVWSRRRAHLVYGWGRVLSEKMAAGLPAQRIRVRVLGLAC